MAESALDLSDIFLNKAATSEKDFDQRMSQQMKTELHKANDLIRRLSEENEYHLRQVERLVRKLEIYKQSARGSSAVRKAE